MAETVSHAGRPRAGRCTLSDLDDGALERVFAHVDFEDRKSVLPCVCKRWRSILYAPSPLLWGAVTLEPALDDRRPPGFRQVANWVKMRAPRKSACEARRRPANGAAKARRVQGISHLRMHLFDYTLPGNTPALLYHARFNPAIPPPQPHFGHLYSGYPIPGQLPAGGAHVAPPPPPWQSTYQLFPHWDTLGSHVPAPDGGHAQVGAHFHAPHGPRQTQWAQPSVSAMAPPWHPSYQPDRPLQAGFLRSILVPSLAHLRSLQLLRCSKALDAEDYRAIGRCTRLEDLSIDSLDDARRRRTEHTSFAFLAHLGRLQHLSLQLPLRGLPAPVWMLTDLRSLVLRGASDLAFPDEFAQLEELTRLELLECGLERVPPVVCRCEDHPSRAVRKRAALQELSLASNPLVTEDDDEDVAAQAPVPGSLARRLPSPKNGPFPADIGALARLKTLTLNCCDLEQLPDALGRLTGLHTLHASDNRADALQHAFFMLPTAMADLSLLRVLHMANCKLEAVPLELPLLRGLRHLHLSGNLIYELPSTLAALSRLETLDLRRNRVHRVPGVVTALAALSTLDLSENGELQFDAAAVAVAALPRLRNFSFPRPCESFCWTAAAGVRNSKNASTSAAFFVEMCGVLQARADTGPTLPHCTSLSAPGVCQTAQQACDMQQRLARYRSGDSASEALSLPDSDMLDQVRYDSTPPSGSPTAGSCGSLDVDVPSASCGYVRLPPLPNPPSTTGALSTAGEASTSQAAVESSMVGSVCLASSSMMSAGSLTQRSSMRGMERESDVSRMTVDLLASEGDRDA